MVIKMNINLVPTTYNKQRRKSSKDSNEFKTIYRLKLCVGPESRSPSRAYDGGTAGNRSATQLVHMRWSELQMRFCSMHRQWYSLVIKMTINLVPTTYNKHRRKSSKDSNELKTIYRPKLCVGPESRSPSRAYNGGKPRNRSATQLVYMRWFQLQMRFCSMHTSAPS